MFGLSVISGHRKQVEFSNSSQKLIPIPGLVRIPRFSERRQSANQRRSPPPPRASGRAGFKKSENCRFFLTRGQSDTRTGPSIQPIPRLPSYPTPSVPANEQCRPENAPVALAIQPPDCGTIGDFGLRAFHGPRSASHVEDAAVHQGAMAISAPYRCYRYLCVRCWKSIFTAFQRFELRDGNFG